jgi:CheY-like chemotaxis protein
MNHAVINNPKATILVIDDIPENLALLTELLEMRSYEVRVARSGKLALRSLDHFTPDLIILDIKMPYLDGYQVCYWH